MNKVSRQHIKLTLVAMALLLVSGAALAQNDPQFVIKKGNNYLSHVNNGGTWQLQNATTFDPATCLWYSGPNVKNNFYFMDGSNRRYLSAPLVAGASLFPSESNPGTQALNAPSNNYYFYAWDHGVARGVQHSLEDCQGENPALPNGLDPTGNQCWEAVWVSYDNDAWKMSTAESYSIILEVSALQHRVTVTEHDEEISNEAGGITNLVLNDFAMEYSTPTHASHSLNGTATDYSYSQTPAYTSYVFEAISVNETNNNNHINSQIVIEIPEESHYYYNGSMHTSAPSSTPHQYPSLAASYNWTLTGAGATYLSFSDSPGQSSSTSATPTVWYCTQNTSNSHKQATLTLTVTYATGVTQTRSAIITVKTQCQNPAQASAPVVNLEGVTVSWLPTADSYTVSWRKVNTVDWTSAQVGNVTSYTIRDLEGSTTYEYKVKADCSPTEPSVLGTFTTMQQNAVILGSVFGGGRMANVTGKTEVVIVNCDSIGAVYGGNDIAGTVVGNSGANGSTITLGVNSGDTYATTYGTTDASIGIRIGEVYGGGNGYYAYNGSTIEQASYNTTYDVANGASIVAFTPSHPEGVIAWTNNTGTSQHLVCPTIPKADITVTNDYVKIDSLFGGAKNAILNNTTNDVNITINGGTIFTVFGGNNFGGSLGYKSKENIIVNNTTVKTTVNDYQANRMGRDFGIGYLFGGGNKVQGQNIEITVNGGQMDTVFGGGNSADVRSTKVTVDCDFAAATSGSQFGKVFSDAISSCSGESPNFTLTIKDDYQWEGKGIYNVRTLFGGNNQENMAVVPTLDLVSGSIGTVYGGGNAGDMTAQATDDCTSAHANLTINDNNVKYGTHVKTDSPYILMDYLYGGCQMSNVAYSTWVEVKNGHVGTVYGGCNISGDVGSTRVYPNAAAFVNGLPNPDYQKVFGAPYVVASGGTVYKNVFAGSNGQYHCKDADGIHYIAGINYDPDHSYVGMTVPTHNESYVVIKDNVLVKGNVYAGGNMAAVGFNDPYGVFPGLVGLASVNMSGGTVDGNVFGGGNMAPIYGSNQIQVSGGSIGVRLGGALYGGNDRLGKAGVTSNRVLPPSYNFASDGVTSLNLEGNDKVKTYLGVTGKPIIHTVYGGGNGAYTYTEMPYCDVTNLPIQSNIFVDIAIDGGENGGHIQNVYGGGNGVEVINFAKVFINVQNCENDTRDHVDTIYGGNNMGDLSFLPDIILLHGNVNTVYGGCNKGAMTGDHTVGTYQNIGSFVHLRNTYPGANGNISPTAKVTGAVYGGCRSNGVTNNSLVLVEGGIHPASFFGGSDISGTIGGTSRVVVTGGIVGNVYGGGNGNYDYTAAAYQGLTAPKCSVSQVDILGGQVGASGENGGRNIFGGGLGAGTQTTGNVAVNIGPATATSWEGLPFIYGNVYGGSAFGSVNSSSSNTTTVNFLNGTLHGNVFGGGLGDPDDDTKGWTKGVVTVNISNEDQTAANCFIDLRDASVFGCNNTNGSPQDNVTVNVYKTAYNYEDYTTGNNYQAENGSHPYYAIDQVFGGGNEADYAPENGSTTSSKKATVNIFSCNNTVRQVFGGGNAAAAIGVATNVYGGRFDQVFGGGNGSGGAANIGSGGTNLMVSGGIIRQLFGGSNLNGTITGDMRVNVTNSGDCTEDITEFFGGSNEASIGTTENPANLVTTIGCNTNHPVNITDIYGGSNLAAITGNVTLNINGGNFSNVYAGSKGIAGSGASTGTPANITGNTTLNLYGGTIDKAFGGCNANGNITGTIQVNLEDTGDCPLLVNTVYGGGNLAKYEPTYTPASGQERISPEVNVKHATVNDAVYGGGLGASATITASPKVTIGDNVTGHRAIVGSTLNGSTTQGEGNVFGGGDAAAVNGSTLVVYDDQNTASQVNRLFGGGNEAGVNSATVNMNHGKVLTGIYGGCNSQGTVGGDIEVNINGGTLGVEGTPMTSGIFGGGYGQPTQTSGNVVLNVGDGTHNPTIYADVYGGSALGKVNTQNTTTDKTTVNFAKGTLYGNLYGGGLGDSSNPAEVYGSVEVNIGKDKTGNTISGGTIYGSVFGANNVKGSPEGSVTVNVYSATIDSIFGGGNQADYVPATSDINYPNINISGGEVTYKVVGGGNAANIGSSTNLANPQVNISGGTVCTGTTKAGVYGGCNTTGTVNGDITVSITGTETSQTTIGTTAALDAGTPINIFGGGYGHETATTGNVTVNFGTDEIGTNSHCEYPKLYGDLYGGSALGNVNSGSEDQTTINILNGTLIGSDVYGGGLGDASHPAKVWGVVHVNIGADTTAQGVGPFGQASFPTYVVNNTKTGGNVYGCNNVNGSPQQSVFVDVYQTTHTHTDSVEYMDQFTRTHAIQRVFGGGNRADYHPVGNSNWEKKVQPFIHFCTNTINSVYGGGNAADVDEVEAHVEGGRFEFVFGGGNGRTSPADVMHNVNFYLCSGHIGYAYAGCDMNGSVHGDQIEHNCNYSPCNDPLVVENFYFGANEALIVGGLDDTIKCADNMNYLNVFAGSRLAIVYGDIKLTVRGGNITNLFGGSQGALGEEGVAAKPGDVRRFPLDPATDSVFQTLSDSDKALVLDYMHDNPGLEGTGGNIYLKLEGGDIENVFGGCERLGNVEGEIVVIIDSTYQECPLDVDYVYGGSRFATITPYKVNGQVPVTPKVYVKNGHVNYDVFGGSLGDSQYPDSLGLATCNPKVIVGDLNPNHKVHIGRDVFGGGSSGGIKGNTKVILQGKTTVNRDVFGGAAFSTVDGSTDVVVVTKTHSLGIIPSSNGSFTVTDVEGIPVSNNATMAEGDDLRITATPAQNYVFSGWTVTGGASVSNPSAATTTFTMGTENATITATFTHVDP